MTRLTHPTDGTVVRCEGDLAAHLRHRGWVEVKSQPAQSEAASEKPRTTRKPGRPRKIKPEEE